MGAKNGLRMNVGQGLVVTGVGLVSSLLKVPSYIKILIC